jgi:hypothetical protein
MAICSLLIDVLYSEPDFEADRILEANITSEILNQFHILFEVSIDRVVDGDLNRFAELVDDLSCIRDLEPSFPGIRDYLTHHILEGITEWDDHAYCRCVAVGLMRFIGRNRDAMG